MKVRVLSCLIAVASPLVLGGCYGPCSTPIVFLLFQKDTGCMGVSATTVATRTVELVRPMGAEPATRGLAITPVEP